MKVIVVKDYEQMSDKAFEIMKQVVVANPNGVLGLATGTTPIGLYKRMIEDCKQGTSCIPRFVFDKPYIQDE